MNIRLAKLLRRHLTSTQLRSVPSSYDTLGSLLIFSDFPGSLEPKQKEIAQAFLEFHPAITTVLKKTHPYSGKYRLPKYRILAGKRSKQTLFKEYGLVLLIHPEKMYFSPRLGNERMRIARLVGKGERVLVMFSGCGVYPLILAKHSLAKEIAGVEINPAAHQYAQKNAQLNHAKNISLYKGDARKVVPKLGRFDRIIMPLPKDAGSFLDVALAALNPGGVVHYYTFWNKKDGGGPADSIAAWCISHGISCRILATVRCGAYGPGRSRYCVDAQIHQRKEPH